MNIKWIGCNSNNFGIGRYNNKIDKIIVHWIVGTLSSCDATFQSPTRLASAHYGVGDDQIHQYVKEEDTAWHAGNLLCNRQSIGIEHQGGPDIPISEATYKSSAELIADICKRYSIPLDRDHIKGHKEVSDKPTTCPGVLNIDKLISLAKGDNMTDEQKRILDFIGTRTEGDVRQAFGALADLPNLIKEIDALKKLSQDLSDRVAVLESENKANNELILDWQSQLSSAKGRETKLQAELKAQADEKNQWKNRYEQALKDQVNKYTGWQLVRMGIQKLIIQSKK